MKISIRNIAKLKEADIEINGITVIAGPNNTGKSTVGKTLFSVFNSLYNVKNKISEEKDFKIINILYDMLDKYEVYDEDDGDDFDVVDLAYSLDNTYFTGNFDDKQLYEVFYETINEAESRVESRVGKENSMSYIFDIVETLKIPQDLLISKILDKKILSTFDGQVNNINKHEEGKISLQVKDKTINISILQNGTSFSGDILSLRTEAIYFDDPFILDDYTPEKIKSLKYRHEDSYRTHLYAKIFSSNDSKNLIDEITAEEKLSEVYKKINEIGVGEMTQRKGKHTYCEKNSKENLRLKNLSSGLKTFVIIKKLLHNGNIEKNGTIILDEPEIHLHPEWQLIFAEIIVLLQKTFGLHILLNTHSPYFLRAIQVYAAKHEIADTCKYYLSRIEGHDAYIDDVTEATEKIFSSLAKPFQELEDEVWANS